MSQYMLISSRDPFTCASTVDFYELAQDLKRRGHTVTLFLVENGVLPSRRDASCDALAATVAAGVPVVADDFSLRERAIPASALREGIATAPLDSIIDALAVGAKTVWH